MKNVSAEILIKTTKKDEDIGLNNMLWDILFQYTSDEGRRMYLLKCDKNRDEHKKYFNIVLLKTVT